MDTVGARGIEHRHAPHCDAPSVLRVGFVNNMPDAAFSETERQFSGLIRAGTLLARSTGREDGRENGRENGAADSVEVRRYWMEGVACGDTLVDAVRDSYLPIEALFDNPPDALIVTGTEPCSSELRSEPAFEPLARLLRWCAESVPSTLLSCLAAHAALLVFDGLERTPLASKHSGVFANRLDVGHPLAVALRPDGVTFPHSRLNDVPRGALERHGYRVAFDAPEVGWTVATKEFCGNLVVMFQGHPEYASTTLLREYRRDVRRYLEGRRPTFPSIPSGYLDSAGTEMLEAFAALVGSPQGRYAAGSGVLPADKLMEAFPFRAAARHVCVDWQASSEQLVANWLIEVRRRARRMALR